MNPPALLPIRKKCAADFIALKIHRPGRVWSRVPWGSVASTLTITPPRRLRPVRYEYRFCWAVSQNSYEIVVRLRSSNSWQQDSAHTSAGFLVLYSPSFIRLPQVGFQRKECDDACNLVTSLSHLKFCGLDRICAKMFWAERPERTYINLVTFQVLMTTSMKIAVFYTLGDILECKNVAQCILVWQWPIALMMEAVSDFESRSVSATL
jgi:hypothetical protein